MQCKFIKINEFFIIFLDQTIDTLTTMKTGKENFYMDMEDLSYTNINPTHLQKEFTKLILRNIIVTCCSNVVNKLKRIGSSIENFLLEKEFLKK